MLPPSRTVIRRDGGLYALERALQRRGFALVAGADEAGRGACAGPLVVAAAILPEGRRGEVPELADSKLLTPAARDRVYDEVMARATATSVVVIPPGEVDARGLHVSNLAGMRRALAGLPVRPDYVLTDGFRVDGLGVPSRCGKVIRWPPASPPRAFSRRSRGTGSWWSWTGNFRATASPYTRGMRPLSTLRHWMHTVRVSTTVSRTPTWRR